MRWINSTNTNHIYSHKPVCIRLRISHYLQTRKLGLPAKASTGFTASEFMILSQQQKKDNGESYHPSIPNLISITTASLSSSLCSIGTIITCLQANLSSLCPCIDNRNLVPQSPRDIHHVHMHLKELNILRRLILRQQKYPVQLLLCVDLSA